VDKKYRIGWGVILMAVTVSALLSVIAFHRLTFNTDIISAIPTADPVIAAAGDVIDIHPAQDMFVIDVTLTPVDQNRLVTYGRQIEQALGDSGLFQQVGLADMRKTFPLLLDYIVDYLPMLLTEADLNQHLAPLITPDRIRTQLAANLRELQQMDGLGQAGWMAKDPLGFRNIVLAKLSGLMPGKKARFRNGFLMTAEGDHLLITAIPKGSGTDTHFARNADTLIHRITREVNQTCSDGTNCVTLTSVGAWRAALDNERLAKADTKRAIIMATVGIIILLLFAFPRPYLGLLALLPAVFGTMAALFTYSLFFRSISLLSVGFGGAIISITVDHGIAYLLFLDRPIPSTGRQAAREVWAVGLLAAMTTVGAFLSLVFSGFPLLSEIGLFAAMGMGFSFVFVHTVFPAVFKNIPPVTRPRSLPLRALGDSLVLNKGKTGWMIALALCAVLVGFAIPRFDINLRDLNSVSRATRDAEKKITATWGDFSGRIFLTMEAADIPSLRDQADQLTEALGPWIDRQVIQSGMVISALFPGEKQSRTHFTHWQKFWNPERVTAFRQAARTAVEETGFNDALFSHLFSLIDTTPEMPPPITDQFFQISGIAPSQNRQGWILAATLEKGPAYRPDEFYRSFAVPDPVKPNSVKLFDPVFFAHRLGNLLSSTFIRMIWVLGAGAVLLLLIFFRSIKLAAIALSPLVFSFICTLGTLKLMGRALDIPSLMLSIVIIGMGIDYALYMVRAYQRYENEAGPECQIVRLTILLAAASTLMGFGALCFADHRLLQSAGISTSLGIGYTLLGTFAILPPLLRGVFAKSLRGQSSRGK
jgi:predicted exporter